MKADISADFHAREKRYSGARFQQGRALTDACANAAFDIVDQSAEEVVRTLLCAAGSPDRGFAIGDARAGDDGAIDFAIAAGVFVLGGRTHHLDADQRYLDQSDWLARTLEEAPLAAAPARVDLAYLEAIEQPVRAVEDSEIRERALGVADTTSRLRPQLRVRVASDVPTLCADAAAMMRARLAGAGGSFSEDRTELLSNARLRVRFIDDQPSADPCASRTVTGYLGAENHTLRIMSPEPGAFLWNFDHGGDLHRVTVDAGADEIVFATEPKDSALYPRMGQVVEILPWDALLPNGEKAAAALGHRARLTGEYDPNARRVRYDGSLPPSWAAWLAASPHAREGDDPARYYYARLWQDPGNGGVAQPTGANVELPALGLSLSFEGVGFAGDYWTVSLRTDAPTLALPWRLAEEGGAPPTGPRRFVAPLATLRWTLGPDDALEAEIEDCRRRFRPLAQIQGCRTIDVGDGHASRGDVDDLQVAVDALPRDGGEIRLLPGRHRGGADLRGRRGVTIRGCGARTIVEAADDARSPIFSLQDAVGATLRDFRIETRGAVAIGGARSASATLRDLEVETAGRAIALADATDLLIASCAMRARSADDALQSGDLADLGPLVFVQGRRLRLEDCRLEASGAANRNRVALGGLQIGGRSRDVRIAGNRILGGNGNGITLGSVGRRGRFEPIAAFDGPQLFAWVAIDNDGCFKVAPPGVYAPRIRANQAQAPRVFSHGALEDVEIVGNRIEDHGASGVSVAYWFVADEETPDDALDDIEIRRLKIADNLVRGCMALDIAASPDAEAAFASAMGGIALSAASDAQIENNDIRECGRSGRTPICGIYLRDGARLHIADNRIYDNGRPASATAPVLLGAVGGVVLPHVDGRDYGAGAILRETPAVVIRGNTVVAPEGPALEIVGDGQMLVSGNAFATHGDAARNVIALTNPELLGEARPPVAVAPDFLLAEPGRSRTIPGLQALLKVRMAQLSGGAVAILNTGVDPNLERGADFASTPRSPAIGRFGAGSRWRLDRVASGMVTFDDNAVIFDAVYPLPADVLCAVGVTSRDSVGMRDCEVVVDGPGAARVLINTIVLGLSAARVQGNRFREPLRPQRAGEAPPVSAMTMGRLNATEMNQGVHCFLALGRKKPRIVGLGRGQDARLDTNRHEIDEERCARLREIEDDFGAPPPQRPSVFRPDDVATAPGTMAVFVDQAIAAAAKAQTQRDRVKTAVASLDLAAAVASDPARQRLEERVATERSKFQAQRSEFALLDATPPAQDDARAQVLVVVVGEAEAPPLTAALLDGEGANVVSAAIAPEGGAILEPPTALSAARVQVSDSEGRVLYRDAEPFAAALGVVVKRVAALDGPLPAPRPAPERARMPDLLGQREALAVEALRRLGVEPAIETRADGGPAGVVVEQDPEPGREIVDGASIRLVVSAAREDGATLDAPAFVGRLIEEAAREAQRRQMDLEVTRAPNQARPGEVIDQSPSAGQALTAPFTMALEVSTGPPPRADAPVPAPSLVGRMVEEAEALTRGLRLGFEAEETPSGRPERTVLVQSQAAGTLLPRGETIIVTFSNGDFDPEVPAALHERAAADERFATLGLSDDRLLALLNGLRVGSNADVDFLLVMDDAMLGAAFGLGDVVRQGTLRAILRDAAKDLFQ